MFHWSETCLEELSFPLWCNTFNGAFLSSPGPLRWESATRRYFLRAPLTVPSQRVHSWPGHLSCLPRLDWWKRYFDLWLEHFLRKLGTQVSPIPNFLHGKVFIVYSLWILDSSQCWSQEEGFLCGIFAWIRHYDKYVMLFSVCLPLYNKCFLCLRGLLCSFQVHSPLLLIGSHVFI